MLTFVNFRLTFVSSSTWHEGHLVAAGEGAVDVAVLGAAQLDAEAVHPDPHTRGVLHQPVRPRHTPAWAGHVTRDTWRGVTPGNTRLFSSLVSVPRNLTGSE